jgi:hypothetical protein
MIIKYPTGLYRDELKTFVAQTNVTYNISNSAPPRSNIVFVKLPTGERLKPRQILESNRALLGDLIFTTSSTNSNNAQSTQKLLETGALLDFNAPESVLTPIAISLPSAEISHNLYYLDYADLGLSDADVSNINHAVNSSFALKTQMINGLKNKYANVFNEIQNLQKKNNDLTRAISAMALANDTGLLTDYIERLMNDQTNINVQIIDLNNQLNAVGAQIMSETDSLNALGALVK